MNTIKFLLSFLLVSGMGMTSCNEKKTEPIASLAYTSETSTEDLVYITPYGKRYHVKSCSTIVGHDIKAISRDEAESQGRTPCKRCHP